MGLFGPPNVEKLKSEGNIGGLIKALGYKKDPVIIEAASTALVELAPASIEPLVLALGNKEELVSQSAAETLVKIGMPAVEALIAGMVNYSTRNKCIGALKKVGESAVIRAVDQAASWVVEGEVKSKIAVQILAEIGPLAVSQLISLLKDQRTDKSMSDDNPMFLVKANIMEMIPHHADLLQKGIAAVQQGSTICCMIAGALGKIGNPEAVDPLIATMAEEDDFYRWVAAGSLFQIGSRIAMTFLNDHLDDDDLLISGTGNVWLLLGDGKTIKRLLDVLLSDQEQASQSAAKTLQELGSKLHDIQ